MKNERRQVKRTAVRLIHGSEDHDDGQVAGKAGDLFEMVWEITCDLWAFGGKGNVEQRLQRDVTTLVRRAS